METELIEQIRKDGICQPGSVLVAVSGGVDSMYLLDVVRRAGCQPQVAHCNFQLRGADSDADERLVKDYCKEFDIPFHSKNMDLEPLTTEGMSTQMAARESRYEWFSKLMKELNLDVLLVGTHQDDLSETVLLNLARGMGHESLTGIPSFQNGIYRPLLSFTREQILTAAHKVSLKWREDKSNASLDYERNRIRHKIIPVLNEVRENATSGIVQSSKALNDSFDLLMHFLTDWKEKNVEESGSQITIPKAPLEDFPNPSYVLFLLVKHAGFSFDSVCQLYLAKQKGKRIGNSEFELWMEREAFVLKEKVSNDFFFRIDAEDSEIRLPSGGQLLVSRTDNYLTKGNANIEFFDIDELEFPLVLRHWQSGDRLEPLGMKGSQKVSDVLTNAKVPSHLKSSVLVLLSGDKILWVVGIRRSRIALMNESTADVLSFELKPKE